MSSLGAAPVLKGNRGGWGGVGRPCVLTRREMDPGLRRPLPRSKRTSVGDLGCGRTVPVLWPGRFLQQDYRGFAISCLVWVACVAQGRRGGSSAVRVCVNGRPASGARTCVALLGRVLWGAELVGGSQSMFFSHAFQGCGRQHLACVCRAGGVVPRPRGCRFLNEPGLSPGRVWGGFVVGLMAVGAFSIIGPVCGGVLWPRPNGVGVRGQSVRFTCAH